MEEKRVLHMLMENRDGKWVTLGFEACAILARWTDRLFPEADSGDITPKAKSNA